ncbi:hypothetical protein Fcan01_23290 [Folsomia candida]|uniref:Uncharacterized protein n=1 Tax=Folsomia candida TaxID=158441 RepID=A0A226DBS2_FOLCA|nr:hypothetical protein Fcan01_23290 [Folsomia candida]
MSFGSPLVATTGRGHKSLLEPRATPELARVRMAVAALRKAKAKMLLGCRRDTECPDCPGDLKETCRWPGYCQCIRQDQLFSSRLYSVSHLSETLIPWDFDPKTSLVSGKLKKLPKNTDPTVLAIIGLFSSGIVLGIHMLVNTLFLKRDDAATQLNLILNYEQQNLCKKFVSGSVRP